ncbi:FKBP-type peptidyl-prolyl cis-trans isomerase N-terminal domain-containing protein [Silanimonas lenta]|jgi:peptidylprolyl isomerase|uniref:FKBP-type peptidyl-prolyl cis-trans isomerase N-terminal domain-containing protein n=1 Tax=Silanimonas lenta TaxID=265429 RepID=UPI00040330EA|nr:FKBP-type peptidyl-prolyl cis-trans isomerase N-terminal domain-containing protein [Silanimonas lenta]
MIVRVLAVALAAAVATAATAQAPANAGAQQAPQQIPQPDKNTLSYALGFDAGYSIVNAKADVDINQVIRGLQDAYNKRQPAYPEENMARAVAWLQQKVQQEAMAEFQKAATENKAKSDAFLAANRAKPGVTVLPSGVQYRVIDAGTGARPTAASEVQLHFRYSLHTGQELANTYASPNAQPATFKVEQFPIAGVREVLPLMPAGSRWEIFVPSDKAFGNDPRSPVGPGQALVFDLKLVNVK